MSMPTLGRSESSSYIQLTPTSTTSASSTPAGDLLARKWAQVAKRKLSRDVSRDLSQHEHQRTPTDTDHHHSRDTTETDQSSSNSGEDDAVSDEEQSADEQDKDESSDLEEEEEECRFGTFPTYVCELHDPKPILIAEHIEHNRIEIVPYAPPQSNQKKTRPATSHQENLFQYEICVGHVQEIFECTPVKVLDVYKTLSRDRAIAEQLRFIETNCVRDGLLGSLKRLYTSHAKVAEEVMQVLESISDIDAVLMHPAYLELIGARKGSALYREIENLLQHHTKTPRSDPTSVCMCEAYQKSVDRFGEFYKENALSSSGSEARFSTVASESLMWSKGILSFYTDTVYVMDKREFRPTHGLKKCVVYGFGRRQLFEIVRISRKSWSVRHHRYGQLYTLSIEKYLTRMNSHHMVAIKRMIPDTQNGGLRLENVCFVKKSKKFGYRCILMAEVVSQGKVTTSISIEQPQSPLGDPHFHYMTMSEISGAARESVCSSTLSVPVDHHKHIQRLHVGGGSDVVLYIALAASYDILVGALTYWMERKY